MDFSGVQQVVTVIPMVLVAAPVAVVILFTVFMR